ncbi:MAG: site-specific integrase [Deltaproteobacteria bacterium]|nr:site-specific integrase [Deltaproteobacteria bacterium]MBW2007759.1 site-specific integrase [Deltaproteobacteria bacterium]MBW2101552.1 site-specific integrase [Deltaproteobacteria bacterium]MBW2347168.1 site-specific integrase [Deltaproteobacteria bacterium]
MGVTVRQKVRGKGQPWWVFISQNGKRTSRKVGDRRAAERVASEIRARIQLGTFGFEEKKPVPTFKEYAERFMKTYSAMNHKPTTRRSYRGALDKHILPYFGSKRLDEVTRSDIKDFITRKQSEGISPSTVRNLKSYLSAIFREALDDEIITANPALGTGRLIKNKRVGFDVNPLTWEEKAKLEETLRKHYAWYYPLFLTLLRTGMRLGEAKALEPGDLDFNGRFIEVRRAYSAGEVLTPKSGKSRRVDMSPELAEVLKRYLVRRKKITLTKGWGEPPQTLFFNREGNPIDINNVRNRVFHKALEKAGLRKIRIHDLRHTYATLRIQAGHNILDVSKQLGHSSVKITLDIYTHWMPGSHKSQVDELDSKTAPNSEAVSK